MAAAIEASGLTKVFGAQRALDDVDLVVEQGSIFGFLGLNGAGKTTMLRILTGLARPTAGTVRILGSDVGKAGNDIRARVGFLPDVPGFYEWMTAPEFLHFAGRLFGLDRRVLGERSEMLLDLAGLGSVTIPIGGYSRGMKQRLGVAQALINAPELLLLDEPTSALDPIGRKDVLDTLASLRGRTTVFFSTHILGDVERVCDTVAILDRGRIVLETPIDELKARTGSNKVVLEVSQDPEAFAAQLRHQTWASAVVVGAGGEIEITVTDVQAAQQDIPAIVAARGMGIRHMSTGEAGLEEVFVELVGNDKP